MKTSLFKLILLVGVIGTGFHLLKTKRLAQNKPNPVTEKKQEWFGSVKGITDNISQQTKDIQKKAQKVGGHVNNVLGAYIKPATNKTNSPSEAESSINSRSSTQSTPVNNSKTTDSNKADSSSSSPKPIYEETFEYGRYLYCQQVVKDYENRH